MAVSSWRIPFFFETLISSLLACFAILALQFTAHAPKRTAPLGIHDGCSNAEVYEGSSKIGLLSIVLSILFLSYVAGGSLPLTTAISLLLREETSATSSTIGFVLSAFGVGYAAGGFVVAKFARAVSITGASVVMMGAHLITALITALMSPTVAIYVSWVLICGICQSVLQGKLLNQFIRLTRIGKSGVAAGVWLFMSQVANAVGLLLFASVLPTVLLDSPVVNSSLTPIFAALFALIFMPATLLSYLTRVRTKRLRLIYYEGGRFS